MAYDLTDRQQMFNKPIFLDLSQITHQGRELRG